MPDKDVTPIEAIDYESLQQFAEQPQQFDQNKKPIIWFAFILLALGLVVVFYFLPNYIAEKHEANVTEEKNLTETPVLSEHVKPEPLLESADPLSKEEIRKLKQQAEELLLQVIEKQKYLESKAIKKWGQDEFRIALSLGTNGDELFRKREYKSAIVAYEEAVNLLSDLEKQVAPTLANHLNKGESALKQGEQVTAIQHFEIAKSIDENNEQAINGLKRAITIKELYTLLEKGGKLEAANRFSDAKTAYQQATELDPLSTEAKSALDRVNSQLAQAEFTRLINRGYAALQARQYGDAKTAFHAAQKISPQSDRPKQGLARIQQAILNERLLALTAEAQHFEANQDWVNAVNSYQEILKLNPNSTSVQQALHENQIRENIYSRLNEHINNYLRLSSDSIANEARQLLNEVASLDRTGSKIDQSANTLKDLLVQANTPIPIILQSDNQTEVAIYKVGQLGKFSSYELKLKPGKYTIVGSRTGFRDIRKIVTVLADMDNKTIQVSCEEPI